MDIEFKPDGAEIRATAGRRLLILSCSQRKRGDPGKIRALERYDGPAYQVVRRYLRERPDPQLDICILSAEYGLISAYDAIADYDRKMDAGRATELRASSSATLQRLFVTRSYAEVFVCMSELYLGALCGIEDLHQRVSHAAPGQGKKLASLRRWLREATAAESEREKSWRK
jgi:hypothetical protein